MRHRGAKGGKQAIAEIRGDMAVKTGAHLGAGALIRPHDLAEVFRVALAREGGRVDEVTKQHGALAACGV
jgi:hypothetical protein